MVRGRGVTGFLHDVVTVCMVLHCSPQYRQAEFDLVPASACMEAIAGTKNLRRWRERFTRNECRCTHRGLSIDSWHGPPLQNVCEYTTVGEFSQPASRRYLL